MHKSLLNNFPLFCECVEALEPELLKWEESYKILDIFKKMYPIAFWGKVDWEKVENKIEVGYDEREIMPAFYRLLGSGANVIVYILWNDASYPIIKTTLEKIIPCYEDVVSVSFETFIFNPETGFILEIVNSGLITMGVIAKT